VIQDVLNVLARRHRSMNVQLYPATVQGPTAAMEFCAALEWFQQQPDPVDIVVLARGGGSLEDLHCFNDEPLARAIAACSIPVISAIGHETDFTIADFAADLRAPTPSAAAEIITAQHYNVEIRVTELARRVERGFRYHLVLARQRFQQLLGSHALVNARDLAARRQQRLDDLAQRMAAAEQARLATAVRRVQLLQDRMMRQSLQRRLAQASARCQHLQARMNAAAQRSAARARGALQQLDAQLHALSPVAILERGYALIYDAQGALLRDSVAIETGAIVTSRLARGSFRSAVTEIMDKDNSPE
jgi:exodeoxyribonuclease VII large subunit